MKFHTLVIFFFSSSLSNVYSKGMHYDFVQKYWENQNSSPILLSGLGFLLVLVVAVLVFLEIRKADHFYRRKMEIGWNRFNEIASKREMSEIDRQDLEIFLTKAQVIIADAVFSSPLVFENCLEAYLDTFLPQIPQTEYEKVGHLRSILGFDKISVDTPYVSTRQLSELTKILIKYNGVSVASSISKVNEEIWEVHNGFKRVSDLIGEVKISLIRFSDGEYSIKTEIVSVNKKTITLKHTRNLVRKQSRNWVRVDISVSVKVKLLQVQSEGTSTEGSILVGELSNISGGGVSLKIPGKLTSLDLLELDFELNGHKFKKILGKVIRMNEAPLVTEDLYEYSVEFEEMESQVRERIIRYVFDRQRQYSQWS